MSVVGSAVQVATTATQMIATAGSSGSPNRRSTVIFNNGPNAIAVSGDNAVTMASGLLIPAGAALTIDHDPSDERHYQRGVAFHLGISDKARGIMHG